MKTEKRDHKSSERERDRGRRPWEIERRWGKEQTLRDRDADERKQRERIGKGKWKRKTSNPSVSFAPKETIKN